MRIETWDFMMNKIVSIALIFLPIQFVAFCSACLVAAADKPNIIINNKVLHLVPITTLKTITKFHVAPQLAVSPNSYIVSNMK
jgi:hypothetical protein